MQRGNVKEWIREDTTCNPYWISTKDMLLLTEPFPVKIFGLATAPPAKLDEKLGTKVKAGHYSLSSGHLDIIFTTEQRVNNLLASH